MSSETSESTGIYDFLAWLEANRQRLALGFVVLVVLGFGFAFLRWQSNQTEVEASEALLQLKTPLGGADQTSAPPASAYLKILSDFPSTSAAQRALLLAAGTFFSEGKYAEAQSHFDRFLREYSDHPLAATAAYGLATSLEAQGKLEEALTSYQNVVLRYPNASMLMEAQLAIARIYELKQQPQLALSSYELMTKTNVTNARSVEAMTRKELLLKKHPELQKAITPAAAATNVPANSAAQPASTNAAGLPTNTVTNAAPAKP